MTDLLFQIALSNVCLSLALAIVAMVIQVTAKRPHLAHLLWLLVLVKLVTPPVVTIPVVTIPGQPDSAVGAIFDIDEQQDEAAAQIKWKRKGCPPFSRNVVRGVGSWKERAFSHLVPGKCVCLCLVADPGLSI